METAYLVKLGNTSPNCSMVLCRARQINLLLFYAFRSSFGIASLFFLTFAFGIGFFCPKWQKNEKGIPCKSGTVPAAVSFIHIFAPHCHCAPIGGTGRPQRWKRVRRPANTTRLFNAFGVKGGNSYEFSVYSLEW